MSEITFTLPLVVLLAATAGVLGKAVLVLWRLDRRMVRVETKLGLEGDLI